MNVEKLALILAIAAIGFGALLWLGALLIASVEVPFFGLLLLPVGLVIFVVLKVVGQRVGNKEEDHYDRIEH